MVQTEQLIGDWSLESFQIESLEGKKSDWGTNAHGLLLYTPTGHMNVSINSDLENNPKLTKEQQIFESILFYSGTYKIEGSIIKHQVTHASNPERIGKEMIRYAEFSENRIILKSPKESFGTAILIWKKI